MKITIYELLGMVKDGKAPKKIKFENHIYKWMHGRSDYFCEQIHLYLTQIVGDDLFINLGLTIEILEEEKKIPEKLTDILRVDDLISPVDENMYKIWTQTIKNHNKINDIIDYLKSKGE